MNLLRRGGGAGEWCTLLAERLKTLPPRAKGIKKIPTAAREQQLALLRPYNFRQFNKYISARFPLLYNFFRRPFFSTLQ